MRTVPGPAQGEERSFDLPFEGQAITVVVKTPTLGQRRRWYAKAGEDGATLANAALAECFVRVEGYFRGDNVPIVTLEDLREYGETAIPELIAHEIITAASLTDEQKKTSGASSGSTSPSPSKEAIVASAGTATSAEPPAFAANEGATDQPRRAPL